MWTEFIGWLSAAILMMTLSRQVFRQWRTGDCTGVSSWLFAGQIAASTGFVIYSWLLANWVFVFTNTFILLTALTGQCVFLHNKRRATAAATKENA